jgi:hypothetical protein
MTSRGLRASAHETERERRDFSRFLFRGLNDDFTDGQLEMRVRRTRGETAKARRAFFVARFDLSRALSVGLARGKQFGTRSHLPNEGKVQYA